VKGTVYAAPPPRDLRLQRDSMGKLKQEKSAPSSPSIKTRVANASARLINMRSARHPETP
jgi:hypothetical protein